MIDMALLSVIRRWHFREGIPIREIERRTGLSRNTIRKYLRTDTVEPKFRVGDKHQIAEILVLFIGVGQNRQRALMHAAEVAGVA